MNLKLHPLYILSFLSMVFLVDEIHQWAHTLAVRVVCHCWAVRLFGNWVLCGTPSSGQHALILFSGAFVNVVLFWTGWTLLDPENSTEMNSLGISLVFVALPLPNLIAAFTGGGDITESLRLVQRHVSASSHGWVARWGLLIQLFIIVPGLYRCFMRLPGYKGRAIVFPLLFLLPGWIVFLLNRQLNHWFIHPDTTQFRAYAYLGGWFVVLAVCFLLTRRALKMLIVELSF